MSYYQTIYDVFRANGLTEAGALAMLGNFDCESNCEPNRVQGDFSPYRTASKQYTADVTSGKISRDQFANDQKGYGLYQLTFNTRKRGYYDFWKQSGKALDDAELQCEYALKEMPTEAPGLLEELKTSNDLYQCVSDVCKRFERPYYNNIDQRYQAALRIKEQINLDPQPVPPEPTPPDPPDPPYEIFWPPRTIDRNCYDWPEVTVLGSVLFCRGYLTFAKMVFDEEMEKAVIDFQKDEFSNDPSQWDGVVGPKTWKLLLEM